MTLLGFKTILHKKCRSDKNSEGPAENYKMKTNFKKSDIGVIFLSHKLIITYIFIYVRVCLFLCSAHIELSH